MTGPGHPSLYEVNVRLLLQEIGRAAGRPATLDDLPEALLERWATAGFDWIWLLGVWQTGAAGRSVSLTDPKVRAGLGNDLPDVVEADIVGSPFAVTAWQVHRDFGGDAALARLRERMARRGLRLLLDFVPNHVALDHPWVDEHPEYFVRGSEEDLVREPQNYLRLATRGGPAIVAHGRDPFFDGWRDTLQLNYRHAGLREACLLELGQIAERGDGVRCDMAMLLQPAVFLRTWGDRALPADGTPAQDAPFWPETINAIRRRHRGFLFVAEVYWDLEHELQQAGFDYTYDKRLYDRLRDRQATPVRDHLRAAPAFQNRSLRFLENHDEPRAAAVYEERVHRAAAVITFLTPGMRFFHEGQLEGRRKHASMHLGRRAAEPRNPGLERFYERLLAVLRRPEVRGGDWRLHDCRPAWEGNGTHGQFIAMSWTGSEGTIVAVSNYAPGQGQCYLPLPDLGAGPVTLADRLGEARYERDAGTLGSTGLYLDMPGWGTHVFAVEHRSMAPRGSGASSKAGPGPD